MWAGSENDDNRELAEGVRKDDVLNPVITINLCRYLDNVWVCVRAWHVLLTPICCCFLLVLMSVSVDSRVQPQSQTHIYSCTRASIVTPLYIQVYIYSIYMYTIFFVLLVDLNGGAFPPHTKFVFIPFDPFTHHMITWHTSISVTMWRCFTNPKPNPLYVLARRVRVVMK